MNIWLWLLEDIGTDPK